VSLKTCTVYDHRITWQRDASADGVQDPDYSTIVVRDMPCKVKQITGDESYRNTQLESHIDYVVEMHYTASVTLKPTDRGVVTGGIFSGKTINVKWVKTHGITDGRPPISEAFCREQFN